MFSFDRRTNADEINAFWNGIVNGTDVRSPALDDALADLIVSIHRADNSPAPDVQFTRRLHARLAHPVLHTLPPSAPAASTVPPRARRAVTRMPPPRTRRGVAWISLIVLLIVSVTISGVFVSRHDRVEEPDPIPAVVPMEETSIVLPGGARQFPIIELAVNPDEIAFAGRGYWNAVAFQLMEIEPGQAFPVHLCSECSVITLLVMQSGSVQLMLDGPVLLSRHVNEGVQQADANEALILSGSDAAVFDLRDLSGDREFQNFGDETARLLLAFLYKVDTPFHAGADEHSLVWTGAWNVEPFMTRDIGFEVDRIVVPPGSKLGYEPSRGRIELLMLASGALEAQSADDEPFPSSLAHSWTAPAGVHISSFPPGSYSLDNPGTGETVLYRLSIEQVAIPVVESTPAHEAASSPSPCASPAQAGC